MNVISIERSEYVRADHCKEFGCIMRYKKIKKHWAGDKKLIVLIVLRAAEVQNLFPLFRKEKWADISIFLSLFLSKMQLLLCRN